MARRERAIRFFFLKKMVQMILKGWILGRNTPKIHPFLENKGIMVKYKVFFLLICMTFLYVLSLFIIKHYLKQNLSNKTFQIFCLINFKTRKRFFYSFFFIQFFINNQFYILYFLLKNIKYL
jgi:hypothetical protein